MSGGLTSTSFYGVNTTNEWAVREYIKDMEENPCIYKGMPLHTEYRVFIDCDQKTVLGCFPYWEPETMEKRFGQEEDADSPPIEAITAETDPAVTAEELTEANS